MNEEWEIGPIRPFRPPLVSYNELITLDLTLKDHSHKKDRIDDFSIGHSWKVDCYRVGLFVRHCLGNDNKIGFSEYVRITSRSGRGMGWGCLCDDQQRICDQPNIR